MKNLFVTLFLIFFTIKAFTQITFKKGYYIDNDNLKIECWIKDVDWKNNPTEFICKMKKDGESQTASIKNIQEFGIENQIRYIRHTVKIDQSSSSINNLTSDSQPIYKEATVFLKVLVEGEANLYLYEEGKGIRLFYNIGYNQVEPLVFKNYISTTQKISQNNRYKQQLLNTLQCDGMEATIKSLKYEKKLITKVFIAYHECKNISFTTYGIKRNQDIINLSIRPRLNQTSLNIDNTISERFDTDFGNKTSFGLGVEFEFILPFHQNKWAIIVEPTYQYFNTTASGEPHVLTGEIITANINYNSIEFPIGIRHYFFLNDHSKLFLNASIITEANINSEVTFNNDNILIASQSIESYVNLAFGVGYSYKIFSIETRYFTNRQLFRNTAFWFSEYQNISIVFGYDLF